VQKYPVRASHRANLTPENLEKILTSHFGNVAGSGPVRSASYGALSRLSVQAAGREVEVDVTMNPQVPEEVARATIARYNAFLEEVTGYTAKERAKRLRKSATAASPEG
jgi:hypothetical protein